MGLKGDWILGLHLSDGTVGVLGLFWLQVEMQNEEYYLSKCPLVTFHRYKHPFFLLANSNVSGFTLLSTLIDMQICSSSVGLESFLVSLLEFYFLNMKSFVAAETKPKWGVP